MTKKLLWCSDSWLLPTGYSQVTRNILSRLNRAGIEVHNLAFQNQGFPIDLVVSDRMIAMYKIYHSLHPNEFYGSGGSVEFYNENIKPDITAFLCDSFMIKWLTDKTQVDGKEVTRRAKLSGKTLFYFPLDSKDAYDGVKGVMEQMDIRVAMSLWAQKILKKDTGIDSSYIPHGVDTNTFRPLPQDVISKVRKENGWNDDTFVVGSVARNQSRKNIPVLFKAFSDFAENKENVKLLMHCLPGETPIMIKRNGVFDIIPIREIIKWKKNGGSETKSLSDIEIWDGKQFVNVLYAKRQVRREKIIRTLTMESLIDSTPEHVMIRENGDTCLCSSLSKTDKIMTGDYPTIPSEIILDSELSWLFGFFVAEGTCGKYKYENGYEYQWKIDCCDKSLIDRAAEAVRKHFGCEAKTVEIKDSRYSTNKIYRLVVSKEVLLALYFDMCYTTSNHGRKLKREKKVPPIIFISDYESQQHFLDGYKEGDGHIINKGSYEIKTNSQTLALGIIKLQKILKPEININILSEERPIKGNQYHRSYYSVVFAKNRIENERNKIKKIFKNPSKELYVYDITTETGIFQAGIGNRVIHNCDPADPQGTNLHDLAKQYKIIDNVSYGMRRYSLGVPEARVNLAYNIMDVHALSTTGEGFGLPIIESMATGTPNICTDYTTAEELIGDDRGERVKLMGTFPYIVGQLNTHRALADKDDMVKKMNKLYENKQLREKYGKRGREHVLKHYNWEKVCRMWLELLEFGEVREKP